MQETLAFFFQLTRISQLTRVSSTLLYEILYIVVMHYTQDLAEPMGNQSFPM